jgi:hypothetical protein
MIHLNERDAPIRQSHQSARQMQPSGDRFVHILKPSLNALLKPKTQDERHNDT